MHEDTLSPEMGRLIDAAKAAAGRVPPSTTPAEGVALLTASGQVHSGYQGDPAANPRGAVESALVSVRRAGGGNVVAAAVAVANDPGESLLPSADCARSLTGLDPGMPVVVKKLGRWVALPLSELVPPA